MSLCEKCGYEGYEGVHVKLGPVIVWYCEDCRKVHKHEPAINENEWARHRAALGATEEGVKQ